MPKFYVTTAIDYPNGKPHVGHSFEKVTADAMARYHRLLGDDVQFCMGLDENSQHVATAARNAGYTPRGWVDEMDGFFRTAWERLDITNDAWIRTTIPEHARASQMLFSRALERGDIYKGLYAGWYCPNCNNYYTDDELVDGKCPSHGIKPEWLEEENYFFALSKYSDALARHYEENPDFIVPTSWRAEIMGLIKQGLRDFSVSRKVSQTPEGETWGIPVPGDPEHVLYVWFDALTNYVTGVGFPDNMSKFERYWPADVHVIGKDITRFHCLYWPAMLMSAGLPLQKQVAVHGFMTLEGKRISKTTGNIIDPVDLVDEFGADTVRYYILREFSFSNDGDFTRARLINRRNADLANDLGNLLNRTVVMANRYLGGEISSPSGKEPIDFELRETASRIRPAYEAALGSWDFPSAIESVWALIRRANTYVEENEPWRLAKEPAKRERLTVVLSNLAESLRVAALYLWPAIPSASDRILSQLGLPGAAPGDLQKVGWGEAPGSRKITTATVLFPRIE